MRLPKNQMLFCANLRGPQNLPGQFRVEFRLCATTSPLAKGSFDPDDRFNSPLAHLWLVPPLVWLFSVPMVRNSETQIADQVSV
jgi:hypothetical protein